MSKKRVQKSEKGPFFGVFCVKKGKFGIKRACLLWAYQMFLRDVPQGGEKRCNFAPETKTTPSGCITPVYYDLNGRMVDAEMGLAPGIYVKRTGMKSQKILVR